MEMGIRGKRALVAGASKGLGLAVARGLAAEGCAVAICSRNEKTLAQAAADMNQDFRGEVFYRAADLTLPHAARDFVRAAREEFGGIDIVVTNAGGPPTGGFDDFDEDDWRKAVELTLLSAQALVREALPDMKAAGWGRVVNMVSISVKQPISGLLLSNSIRSAVIGWAKSLADEVAARGITVNNILPGFFATERVDRLLEHRSAEQGVSKEQALAEGVKDIPLGRMGDPAEFGDLAVFLASERASYITGASYWIDGGLYRGLM